MPARKNQIVTVTAVAAILLLLPLVAKLSSARAAGAEQDKSVPLQAGATTQKDQTDLSVTVYNSNIALVRDVRQIRLQSGINPLRFEDVAVSINPATVHFRSFTDPAKLSVIEQNYEYDLLDPQKLLQKFVGREITLVRQEQDAGSTKWVDTKAVLLSDNNNSPVWKIGNEIATGINAASYRFPDLPGNLYSRPTLIWTLDNRGAEAQRVEASYLTGNMNWNADYVLNVARDEKTADLDGWVTLANNSGASYENAKLQLVAGVVHRTVTELPLATRNYANMSDQLAGAQKAQFQQEGFSEYHLYTLGRRTSIQNNESKQISLLTAASIPVEKYLSVEGQANYYRNPQGIGNPITEPVRVYYRFKNEEKSSLGMPLPAGTIRVYQGDSSGGTQFAGEDTINHTPKDEMVRVYTGNAFDVVCERKQTDYKRLGGNLFEMEYEIALRNHKGDAVTVEVREPVGGDWEVQNSNFKWTKLDATTIGFQIPVAKDVEEKLTYRVRVKY